MSTLQPAMRASHLKENLAAVRRFHPEAADRILARVPEAVAAIDAAARTEWLDLRHDVALTEAVHAEVGTAGVRMLNRKAMTATLEGPLLGPVWNAAVKLFGLKPGGLLRWAHQGWNQIYRDVGELRFVPEGDVGRVVLVGLPAIVDQCNPWVEGVAGAFEGAVQMCALKPEVRAERTGPGEWTFHVGVAAR